MNNWGFILGFVAILAIMLVLSPIGVFAYHGGGGNSGSGNSGSGDNGNGNSGSGGSGSGGGDDDGSSSNSGSGDDDNSGPSEKDEVRIVKRVKNGEERVKYEERKRFIDSETGEVREVRIKIESREKDGELRIFLKVKAREGEQEDELEIEIEDELEVEVEEGDDSLTVVTSDDERKEIKVLPDDAIKRIRERLKSAEIERIELREEVHKNVPRVVYLIEGNQNGKFLGVFKLKLKAAASVDSETGEIVDVRVPWWAFLVSEDSSTDSNTREEPGITPEASGAAG